MTFVNMGLRATVHLSEDESESLRTFFVELVLHLNRRHGNEQSKSKSKVNTNRHSHQNKEAYSSEWHCRHRAVGLARQMRHVRPRCR